MTAMDWDEDEAFRATSLMHFLPADAELVRQFGHLLSRLVLVPDYQKDLGGSPLVAGLGAALIDLRYLARFLAVLGTHQTASGLSRAEIRLSEIAAILSDELVRLTDRLEGSFPSSPR
jgi:hypothetical protein